MDMKTTKSAGIRPHFICRHFRRRQYPGLLTLVLGNLAFASMALAQTNRTVTLDLQCTGQQNTSEMVVTLKNSGNTGTAVVLGTRLGKKKKKKTLSVEARFAEGGRFDSFLYDNLHSPTTPRVVRSLDRAAHRSSYSVTITASFPVCRG